LKNGERKKLSDFEIIDIHNHIFPEKIAYRAADGIRTFYGFETMEGDGTSETLLRQAASLNVKKFIICSAATKFDKVKTANDFIISRVAQNPVYAGLGTTHAGYTDHYNELLRVKRAGLVGIKIHPDIQGFDIDDPGMYDAYRAASELSLPILFHVGDVTHSFSLASKLLYVMEKFPDLTVIAAHMGGYRKKDDAYKYLVGTRAYFDVSEWYNYMTTEDFCEMIGRHGVSRILYGCDYPLNSPYTAAKAFYDTPLSDEIKQMIFSENSKRLFGL